MMPLLKNSAALVFLFIALLFAGCTEEKVNPDVEQSLLGAGMPTQESWNSKVNIYGDNGKLNAILYADHITDYRDRRVIFLQKMKVDFYDSTQTIATRLTADSGKVDDNVNKMYAIGNVVAVNDSGTTLKTQELTWRRLDRKIATDKFVTVNSKKEDLQGYGFESDQNIRNWVIFKPVINTTVKDNGAKK